MTTFQTEQIRLTDLIAPAFYPVHNDIAFGRHTYYKLDGGRGSTKSSFISLEIILGMMRDAKAGKLTNIVLPKGTAGAQKTYKITGLTYNQLYGVRIYPVSTKYQYQTAAEGATATATPVNSVSINTLVEGTVLNLPLTNGTKYKMTLVAKNFSAFPANTVTLWGIALTETLQSTGSSSITTLNSKLSAFYNSIATLVRSSVVSTTLYWDDTNNRISTNFYAFLLSVEELKYTGGISYLIAMQSRIVKPNDYWTRNLYVESSYGASVRYMKASGTVYDAGGGPAIGSSSFTLGACPAINLAPDTQVLATPKVDGSYDFLV